MHKHDLVLPPVRRIKMILNRIAVIPLAALSFGCDAPLDDAKIRSKIVGTCVQHDQFDSGIKLQRSTTYSANGTFTERGERTEGPQVNHYTVAGSYRIEKSTIYYEVLSSSHPGVPVGYKNVNRIVGIDDEAVTMDTPQRRRVVCRWQGNRSD